MSAYDFDLFVIGGGSGGVRAARFAAGYGARVAICEERYWGGTCVNVGCIPKKLFVHGAHYGEELRDAAGYGWSLGRVAFDWPTLRDNKTREIERLNGVYDRMLRDAGCAVLWGRARLAGAHEVALGDRIVSARHILIAVGGRPHVPGIPGREHVVTSDEAFFLERLPERLVIVGGGYIAVEFAGIFRGLGVEVTQLYRGPLFLRGFDDDVRAHLAAEMRKKGIELRFDCAVEAVLRRDGATTVRLEDGGEIDTDLVMYATGRRARTAELGLDEVGVALDAVGRIVIDESFRTSVPSILALGDAVGRRELTPVALAEGMAVAKTLFADTPTAVDYDLVPSAVFSQPPVATVGLSEAQARERHGDGLDIYLTRFRNLKHTVTANRERSLMKLVVERPGDRVIGVHMVGPEAGEIVQGLAVALKAGVTKAQFDATIGIHPTAAEEFVTMRDAVGRAAGQGAGR